MEVAYTLGCVVLNNHDNQEKLKEEEDFKFDVLLDLLQSSNKVTYLVLLKSLYANLKMFSS